MDARVRLALLYKTENEEYFDHIGVTTSNKRVVN